MVSLSCPHHSCPPSLGHLAQTGYLKYRGISQAILGAAQGAGAVFGVLATLCFQKMRLCVGIKSAGLIGIWFQVAFLFISVSGYLCTQQAKNSWPYISFHVDGLPKWFDAAALMGGVAVSRWGLWLFDLSVAQQITEGVKLGFSFHACCRSVCVCVQVHSHFPYYTGRWRRAWRICWCVISRPARSVCADSGRGHRVQQSQGLLWPRLPFAGVYRAHSHCLLGVELLLQSVKTKLGFEACDFVV